MENKLLKILNDELIELKQMTRLAEQRLDLQREELNKHTELLNRHQAGFEIMFSNMQKMEQRLDLEIAKLSRGK